MPAGTFDTIVVGWYSGNDNEIWLVDDFPFPVKALTYAGITEGNAPIMYEFTLLNYKENIIDDPFADVKETIQKEELLNCPTKFHDYTSNRVSTNTHSMIIQYNYSPYTPIEGCNIDWKINFISKYNDVEILDQIHYDIWVVDEADNKLRSSKYNDVEILDQIHYDIWVVDEADNKLRSYAEEIGEDNLYNEFGRVHHLVPIKENAGLVHYAIFVHGTGPESEEPDASMSGFTVVEIEIGKNPLLEKQSENVSSKIPEWIKSNAGWWATGEIDDATFVQAIQFLIKEDILKIPPTTGSDSSGDEIPEWIKSNAGWWANGEIDDATFVQAIQFLIKEGILQIP
jgi:hypothetical protein